MEKIKVLANVDGDNSPASEPFSLYKDDVFGVTGISGDTVLCEYRLHEDQSWQTLYSFTSDGEQVSDQNLECRFRVSSYSAGDISAFVCKGQP